MPMRVIENWLSSSVSREDMISSWAFAKMISGGVISTQAAASASLASFSLGWSGWAMINDSRSFLPEISPVLHFHKARSRMSAVLIVFCFLCDAC